LILVIGGTRGTGRLAARALAAGGTAVRVLARDPLAAREVLPATAEILPGDITQPESLAAPLEGATGIIFTAGRRSGWPSRQAATRDTEFQGVVNTLTAAAGAGFRGRLVYMTSSGLNSRSFWTMGLNAYKGNTLYWRRLAEDAIRASGVEYTIVRAGFLVNAEGGRRPVVVTQQSLPLTPRLRIARADVAAVLVAALNHPQAADATFETVWGEGGEVPIATQLSSLRGDRSAATQHTG
jgi:uncharacterized protein YbjT (DUF2867 family)